MKTQFLTLALAALSLPAFAALGKVNFSNDQRHLVYFDTDPAFLRPEDAGLAGLGVPMDSIPSGITLVADLFAGPTASSLSFATNSLFGQNTGTFYPTHTFLTNVPGGTTGFFQVQIHDAAYATADASRLNNSYFGFSDVFTSNANGTFAFYFISAHSPPSSSTWADGTYDMGTQLGNPALGAIMVEAVPEPALLGLIPFAALALPFASRRKRSVTHGSGSFPY